MGETHLNAIYVFYSDFLILSPLSLFLFYFYALGLK